MLLRCFPVHCLPSLLQDTHPGNCLSAFQGVVKRSIFPQPPRFFCTPCTLGAQGEALTARIPASPWALSLLYSLRRTTFWRMRRSSLCPAPWTPCSTSTLPSTTALTPCWYPPMDHMAIRQRCRSPYQAKAAWGFFLTVSPCTLLPNSAAHTELCISQHSCKDTNLRFGICVKIIHTAADCCSRTDLPTLSPTYAPIAFFIPPVHTESVRVSDVFHHRVNMLTAAASKMCVGTSFPLGFLFLKTLFLSALLAGSINKITTATLCYGMYF